MNAASVDLARSWVHAYACEQIGLAVREARAGHGDGWAQEIREQGVAA